MPAHTTNRSQPHQPVKDVKRRHYIGTEQIDAMCEKFLAKHERCGICFDVPSIRGRIDSCVHPFCFSCIQKWSTTANVCPICTKEFNTITGHDRNNPKSVNKIRVSKSDKRYLLKSDEFYWSPQDFVFDDEADMDISDDESEASSDDDREGDYYHWNGPQSRADAWNLALQLQHSYDQLRNTMSEEVEEEEEAVVPFTTTEETDSPSEDAEEEESEDEPRPRIRRSQPSRRRNVVRRNISRGRVDLNRQPVSSLRRTHTGRRVRI